MSRSVISVFMNHDAVVHWHDIRVSPIRATPTVLLRLVKALTRWGAYQAKGFRGEGRLISSLVHRIVVSVCLAVARRVASSRRSPQASRNLNSESAWRHERLPVGRVRVPPTRTR